MTKRRIDLEWSGEHQTVLFDLENFDLEKQNFFGYEDDTKEIHSRWGGENYYVSNTGYTGAGYCFIPETVLLCNTYRFGGNCITRAARKMPLSFDYTTNTVSLYVPLDYHRMDYRSPIVMVIQEWEGENCCNQLVIGASQFIINMIFTDCLQEDNFETIKQAINECLHDYNDPCIKKYKVEYYVGGFHNEELAFYSNLPYYFGRKFLDDRSLEIDQQENEFQLDEVIENFFKIQKIDGCYYLLDSFNHYILRKFLECSNPIFAPEKEFQEMFPNIDIVYDKDGIRIVKKGVHLLGLMYVEAATPEKVQKLEGFYDVCNTLLEYERDAPQLEYITKKEEILHEIIAGLRKKAHNEIRWAIRKYKKIGTLEAILKELPDDCKITFEDSLESGNCKPGTERFRDEYFPGKDWVYAEDLKPFAEKNCDVRRVLAYVVENK